MLDEEFKECATCSSKPGMPILCDACLFNRNLVSKLQARIRKYDAIMKIIHLLSLATMEEYTLNGKFSKCYIEQISSLIENKE